MITDALLGLIAGFVTYAGSLLPEWSLSLPDGVSEVIGFLMAYDAFIPITEVMVCLASLCTLVLGYAVFKWTIKLVDWIMDVIP